MTTTHPHDQLPDLTTRAACVLGCRTTTGDPFPAQRGYLTCDLCADQLRDALDEIVDLYRRLDPVKAPASGTQRRDFAPGFGSRSPARDGVLALTDPRTHATEDGDPHSVREILTSWADNVRDDIGLTDQLAGTARREARLLAGWLDHTARQPWADPFTDDAQRLRDQVAGLLTRTRRTVETEAAFLVRWWNHITRQEWVTDLADEVYELRHQLRAAAGTADPSVPIGSCPTPLPDLDEGGEVACGALLRARLGADRITCGRCGTSWPREHWDDLRDDLGTPVSDIASLSTWLDKPAGTLRRWRHEDGWTNHGTKSRPLYARADVFASWQRRKTARETA